MASKRSPLGRAAQIARVLAHHELWFFIEMLDLRRLVPIQMLIAPRHHKTKPRSSAVHLRLALIELGPTFIKLGQMLSTRVDILPPAYQRELAKLQDTTCSIPAIAVRALLKQELVRPIEEVFATFETTPLATASIGQVHAATLRDGTEVVVKIRRPGVVEQIEEDLRLLHRVAVIASHRWEAARQYDIVGLVQEFDDTLHAEVNYQREGRNADRFAKNFAGHKTIHIPRIYWEATTVQVLTLERIRGIKVTDLVAIAASGIDRAAISEQCTQIFFKMVFEDGFFHADLHPGNLFIEPNGRIGFVDFGMVGSVDDHTRMSLGFLLHGVAERNGEQIVDALLALVQARQPIDRAVLRRDLERWLVQYFDQPLSAIAVKPLVMELLSIVRRHCLVMPANLAQLMKTVMVIEGMGVQLNPDFHLFDILTPYARRLMIRQNMPAMWVKRLGKQLPNLAWLASEMPQQIRRLLREMDKGSIKIDLHPIGLRGPLKQIERMTNRLIMGVLLTGLVIAQALLLAAPHPVNPGLITGGFVIMATLALMLVWSIVHRSRYE